MIRQKMRHRYGVVFGDQRIEFFQTDLVEFIPDFRENFGSGIHNYIRGLE